MHPASYHPHDEGRTRKEQGLSESLSSAPISHVTFFGSIAALEGVFVLYYSGLKLLSILPVVGVIGVVAILSGSKALGQVQRSRLSGER